MIDKLSKLKLIVFIIFILWPRVYSFATLDVCCYWRYQICSLKISMLHRNDGNRHGKTFNMIPAYTTKKYAVNSFSPSIASNLYLQLTKT